MRILSNLSVSGLLGLNSVSDANTDTDKFLVLDSSGIVRYRTGSEVFSDIGAGGAVTSVGLTMPSAFAVSSSPVTGSGTISVTGAGNATQYIRGDGQLATLPTNGSGGGASVSYYLNGSINQGTIGGVTYYEMNKTPIIGAGTDFSRSSNGYIASFLTDANDPALLNIPAGNWNFETYFQASSGGGSPTFYIELYKYDGTTFTLIASNSATPKLINDGTNIEAYFSALAVPETTLTLTDRLAVRIYVTTSGRTITLHTQNGHLCQVITTFTTGLTALNGLTSQVQYLATGTSGTDFNISSVTATHTFNLPTASATNRGALSSADWTAFNSKQNALTLTTTGSSGSSTLVGATLNVPTYTLSGLGGVPTSRQLTINGTAYDLSADRSWSVGTHTGNLTTGYVPKATGITSLTDSLIYDNGSAIGINTASPYESSAFKLDVNGGVIIKNTSGTAAQLILINSNPATGGNNGFVQLSAGGNTSTAFGQWQTYYGMSVAAGALRLQPAGGQVLIGTTTTSAFTTDINGTLRVSGQLTLGSTISNNTYVYTMPGASGTLALVSDIPSLSGYVPTSRTLTINGVSYDLSADRSWTIAAGVSAVQAGSGISVSTSSGVVTVVNTGLLSGTAGSGISVSTSGQNLNIVNTGLLSGTAGSGISVSTSGQNLNIVNTGLLSATAGSGISVSTTSQNVNIVNTGLLSATAGTGISVSTTSGTLNIVNTITNTNQLTNGAGYITGITSGMVTTALGYTPYNATNPNGYITGYTETDTLASVTGRGNTTTSSMAIGSVSIPNGRLYVNSGSGSDVIALQNSLNTGAYLVFADNVTPTWANAPRLGAISNDMVFKTLDTERFRIASTGASTFSGDVNSSTGFQGRYARIFEASSQRGGLYPYNVISGAGTDYSIGIFSESSLWFAAGGGVTKHLNIASTGAATFSSTISASNISSGINASHIVQRDANGYIYANHINFNTSESENPTISSFITSNGDGWSRKSSLQHVRNQLGNYGGWITGYTETDTLASVTGRGATTSTPITIATNGFIDFGPNSTWGSTLRVGGNGHGGTTRASVCTTNGNLHLDGGTTGGGGGIYLNAYHNGPIYATTSQHLVLHAGNIASYTAGNANSISAAVGGSYTWTSINYFQTNNGGQAVNNSNSASLQAYSTGNNSAFMSFHRGGYYAVNFGLDDDNVMRIGGWSAGANRWVLDMSGNNTVAGSFRAPIFYDSQDTGYYLDPNASGTSANLGGTIRLQTGAFGTNSVSSSSQATLSRTFAPQGASNGYNGGGITAAIKIRLPFRANDCMWSMKVRIYNYTNDAVSEYTIGNYSYSAGAYHRAAHFMGGIGAIPQTVRFGNDGTYDCVWIGETGTSWSYPQVSVMDFQGGYVRSDVATVSNNWNVTFVTSFDTVADSVTPSIRFSNVTAVDIYAAGMNASNVTASSDVRGNDVYTTGGWFRNHSSNNGIYWSNTGWHLYPENASDFYVRSGASDASIHFMRGGTLSNYIHNSAVNEIGFLSTGRSWIFRVENGGTATVYGDLTCNNLNTGNAINVGYTRNNESIATSSFRGIEFHNPGGRDYVIGKFEGSWTKPLTIAFYTGIRHGANLSYNGHRWYNNTDFATITASINDGDNNMRGYYDIIAYASDRRLKENIHAIDNAIDKVKQLTGMTYTWNSVGAQYGWAPSNEREAGVFAQDVQAVLPEAVKLAPFDNNMGVSKSGENFLTVKYEKIVPLLIEAIKEQQTQIEDLKSKLDAVTK